MLFFNKKKKLAVAEEQTEKKVDSNSLIKEVKGIEGLSIPNPVLESGASSFVNYLQRNNEHKLSFDKQFEYYERCEPMTLSIDIIAEHISGITPMVKDNRTDKIVEGHHLPELLQSPSNNKDYSDFMRDFASILLISGSPFLRIIGETSREPVSLKVERPNSSRIEPNRYGDMSDIFVQDEFQNAHYKEESVDGVTRFRMGTDNEYWPAFLFNPKMGTREFYGAAPCQPLYYQIEQYLAGGLHNKSLLENGTRPSGMYTTDSNSPRLTDAQFARMQQQIVDNHQGPSNAGNPMLFEWVKYQELLVNNRDMDYNKLMEDCRMSIFRRFKIPLPLVEQASQKYSNFQVAQVAAYEMAFLPVLYFIFRQLKQALMYRYHRNDWKYYDIVCDLSEIPALQAVRYENVLNQSRIGVNTVNELRGYIGEDPMQGGDVILRPANDVPALDDGEDDYQENNDNKDVNRDQEQ